MKQILTVETRVSDVRVTGRDSLGRLFSVDTDRDLSKGTTVLVKDGIVVGTVKKQTPVVYEV